MIERDVIDKRTMWAIKSPWVGSQFCCAYVQNSEGKWVFFPMALYGTRADARQHCSQGVVKVEVTVREVD